MADLELALVQEERLQDFDDPELIPGGVEPRVAVAPQKADDDDVGRRADAHAPDLGSQRLDTVSLQVVRPVRHGTVEELLKHLWTGMVDHAGRMPRGDASEPLRGLEDVVAEHVGEPRRAENERRVHRGHHPTGRESPARVQFNEPAADRHDVLLGVHHGLGRGPAERDDVSELCEFGRETGPARGDRSQRHRLIVGFGQPRVRPPAHLPLLLDLLVPLLTIAVLRGDLGQEVLQLILGRAAEQHTRDVHVPATELRGPEGTHHFIAGRTHERYCLLLLLLTRGLAHDGDPRPLIAFRGNHRAALERAHVTHRSTRPRVVAHSLSVASSSCLKNSGGRLT